MCPWGRVAFCGGGGGEPEVAHLWPPRSRGALPFFMLQVGISATGGWSHSATVSASIPTGPAGFPTCPEALLAASRGCKSQPGSLPFAPGPVVLTHAGLLWSRALPGSPCHPHLADHLQCSSGWGEWPSAACSTVSGSQSCLHLHSSLGTTREGGGFTLRSS